MLCIRSNANDAEAIMNYIFQKFPDLAKNEVKNGGSLLGRAFLNNSRISWRMQLSNRSCPNPIIAFLRMSRTDRPNGSIVNTNEDKILQLTEIAKFYNFGDTLKTDLNLLRKLGLFRHPTVKENLPVLFEFCTERMGSNFLRNCFGDTYGINDPISWRYKVNRKFAWLVVTLKNEGFDGIVRITNTPSGIKVRILYII